MNQPLPWEKPLNVRLPEPMTCIGCGRHGRELLEEGSGWAMGSEPHGLGLCHECWPDEDIRAEYFAARAALWAAKREPLECDGPSRRFSERDEPEKAAAWAAAVQREAP